MGLNAVQSYPAERVLVAALLGRPASFHELGGRVTEEMFTEPGLRLVFRAFAELASRGERIDMATVEAEMFRLDHRLYGELNGVSFLSAMLQAVLSGRPSMGKTAVALHMALQAARAGRNTLYFSIEMSEEEVTERILSMLSGVEAGKIRFKGTNREERALLEKAAAELAGLPLRIVYCGLSRPEIG